MQLPGFSVIGADLIQEWVRRNPQQVVDIVQHAYQLHARGQAINPDSYFLRFPDDARNRIIALPASLEDGEPMAGIKWIASFPGNIGIGLDRASAVLILNDRHTGYPRACLEGSVISAVRTAAAGAIGARFLHPTAGRIEHLSVVGCGLIAYQTLDLLTCLGWQIGSVSLIDTDVARCHRFAARCRTAFGLRTGAAAIGEALPCSDMVLFATSAGTPHVDDAALFRHAPTVLHLSLRDLAPELILAAQNVVDDVDHCLKAQTSLHLAEQQSGTRSFVAGGVAGLIGGEIVPDPARTRIFSPFGMGILDLAVARALLDSFDEAELGSVPGFFPQPFAA